MNYTTIKHGKGYLTIPSPKRKVSEWVIGTLLILGLLAMLGIAGTGTFPH